MKNNKLQADDIDRLVIQWQQQGISEDLLPMAIYGRLARIYKQLERVIQQCHAACGLKPGEFDVLASLRRSGEPFSLSPTQLYQSMLLSSGAMTNRLDKLEEKGLIKRSHCSDDRRSVQVKLTNEGKALIDEAFQSHLSLQHDFIAGLSKSDQKSLNTLLKHWLVELTK
ncbi:MarR family transcriptional regulator [Zooshikella marina]|uniref:MarR family winged helix-turn-helix transcriptional regulator n=1 Tax=Zooshikella ganghwensis TaxID=202772 RepID=UPI001BAF2C32|nr:MarR family transcriptional regulator [Zooshikella ganghwensis]MBU2708368.1 MarR family transcriptional regulator [Zooshikella ganghwensis]